MDWSCVQIHATLGMMNAWIRSSTCRTGARTASGASSPWDSPALATTGRQRAYNLSHHSDPSSSTLQPPLYLREKPGGATVKAHTRLPTLPPRYSVDQRSSQIANSFIDLVFQTILRRRLMAPESMTKNSSCAKLRRNDVLIGLSEVDDILSSLPVSRSCSLHAPFFACILLRILCPGCVLTSIKSPTTAVMFSCLVFRVPTEQQCFVFAYPVVGQRFVLKRGTTLDLMLCGGALPPRLP
ncbi:hypothetical protein AB1N83_011840 [Pleurotus pulmonarius]